ncbi:MAG: STAS domain-containing protein [Betaproteobacteria bacterium]|jgi:phospholipid transport system transporter-binding protein|nr:STAS domain-containing protein [Betaproteobacteria bacterium]MBK7655382.1 STAS domain-containing protein [Betaproteobacteria bacterium]MBP6646238.1 STAS domain-containing protein [Burkholderiaceae bacterium]
MLALPEVLTLSQANACLGRLVQGLSVDATPIVVVDAARLRTFDSAALAVLMECRRVAAADRKPLQIHGMPSRLRELAMLYGVSDLLPDSTALVA